MSKISFTASSLERVMACPNSEMIGPHVNSSSEFAEAGNARHRYLELLGHGYSVRNALLEVAEEYRAECEAIDISVLPLDAGMYEQEVTYAYNVDTGVARVLGLSLNRDYSAKLDCEIVGTIDVAGASSMHDYKGHKYVSAKDNKQLLFAALCKSRIAGPPPGTVTLEIINLGGGYKSNRTEVDEFDVAAFESKLLDTVDTIDDGKLGTFRAGEHCRYCPAKGACPQFALNIREGDEIVSRQITADNAAEWYRSVEAASDRIKHAKKVLYSYAALADIDMGDGTVFGRRTANGNESLDGDIAYGVLLEDIGRFADTAVKKTVTKSGISKAVKLYVEQTMPNGTTQAGITRQALATIRQRGGISRKTTTKIGIHKKAKELK